MPTESQKRAIDKMDESELRKQFRSLSPNHHKEILNYIQDRLDNLNVDDAMVEDAEIKNGEFFQ